MIGENIRPGMTRGGFSPGCTFLTKLPERRRRYGPSKWDVHKDVREACDRILENRMPSVVTEGFMRENV